MSTFFETMRCLRLQERMHHATRDTWRNDGRYDVVWFTFLKEFRKFGINVPNGAGAINWDFLFRIHDEHYDWFCDLEKLFLGHTQEEMDRLERKVEQLTLHVAELEERIACVPFGTKYEEAKEEFKTKCHDVPSASS